MKYKYRVLPEVFYCTLSYILKTEPSLIFIITDELELLHLTPEQLIL